MSKQLELKSSEESVEMKKYDYLKSYIKIKCKRNAF